MPDTEFSRVLDTACRSAGIDLEEEASSTKLAWNGASHLRHLADRIVELVDRLSPATPSLDSYLENAGESRAKPESKSTDPQAVAEELHITAEMSFSDLSRLRREFALANHPDRADAAARENATRRMMVANMLIDRELKRKHSLRPAIKH
ncbi:MAG: hypothetical protein WAW96_16820 [Alphaproteobacteria bacterium]